jgi:HNH endonuclease
MSKSRGILAPRRHWTDVEVELLRRNYADSRTEDLAAVLGRKLEYVYAKARKLGLCKSEAYLASPAACRLRRGDDVGAPYRFPKGHVPANKGVKHPPGWAPGALATTQFKKGRPAHEARNYLPIGSLRLSKDGYLERKVTDDPTLAPVRRWVGVHRLVWIAANGPVPPQHIVAFKRGRRTTDPALITLDALELITLAENMRRNSLHNYPREIVHVHQLRAALTRQINRRANTEDNSHEP